MVSELEAYSMDVEFRTKAVLLELLRLKGLAQAQADSDSPLAAEAGDSMIKQIDNEIQKFRFSGMAFENYGG